MLRWILFALAVLGLAFAFTTKSTAVLGLALLSSLVGVVGFLLSLAASRVASNARPDTAMASVEELVALGKRRAAARAPTPGASPNASAGRGGDAER
jgi:hypothetical protein